MWIARSARAVAACVALGALGSLALGCEQSLTQLVVVIDTDLAVPDEIDRIDLTVAARGAPPLVEGMLDVPSAEAFPLTLGVVADSDDSEVTVTAVAMGGGVEIVRRSARATFVAGETRMIVLRLVRLCTSAMCGADETCGDDGSCRSDVVSANDLPAWDGAAPARPASLGSELPWPELGTSMGPTYYVAPGGADTNDGSEGSPWASLDPAGAVEPGATVLMRAGTYPSQPGILARGAPGAPITIGAQPGEIVVVGGIRLEGGSEYVRVTGLVVDALSGSDMAVIVFNDGASPTHHVEIAGNEVRNAMREGITARGSDHRVVRNWVHNNGTDPDRDDGIQLEGERMLVANNVVHDNAGFGITGYPGLSGSIVTGNTVVANGHSGISLGGTTRGVLAVNNVVALHTSSGGSAVGHAIILSGSGPGNAVRANMLFDNAVTNVPVATTGESYVFPDNLEMDPAFILAGPGAPVPPGACPCPVPPAVTRDLHLGPASPAIDAARIEWGLSPDIDGVARPVRDRLDLGAYEAQ